MKSIFEMRLSYSLVKHSKQSVFEVHFSARCKTLGSLLTQSIKHMRFAGGDKIAVRFCQQRKGNQ